MDTYTTRFLEVKVHTQRRVECPGCGKKRTVRRTFCQTVNPYHPEVKALPLTATYDDAHDMVRESVRREAEDWVPSDYEARHVACVEERAGL